VSEAVSIEEAMENAKNFFMVHPFLPFSFKRIPNLMLSGILFRWYSYQTTQLKFYYKTRAVCDKVWGAGLKPDAGTCALGSEEGKLSAEVSRSGMPVQSKEKIPQ
jgi:hypothetical protein